MILSRRQFLKRTATASSIAFFGAPGIALSASNKTQLVTIRPREYAGAFANPLKGFRPDVVSDHEAGQGLDNPLVTVVRHYIRWNQIENRAGDGVEKILEFCNAKWSGVERRNQKIIPRVYLHWPDRFHSPADMNAWEYGSRKFLYRLEKLIAKLGAAWNHDPRVAYIETGIVGPCGEQWGPTPHAELKKVIGDSYAAAFPDKLCMIRYPWNWMDYEFGVFWDSWGTHKDTARMLEVLESPALNGSWKTRVRGGEIAYGFGEPPGNDPNDTMATTHHVDWLECLVRRGHWNHLGWVSEYDWKKTVAAANGQKLQKSFGYRFVVDEVNYPASVAPGGELEVSFTVRNTGSSPFYYNWPLVVSLLDEQTRQPVWQEAFASVDIRKWLPGDRWMQFADWNKARGHYVLDHGPARYEIPAATNQVAGRFQLPRNMRRGTYLLALAILDPAGMKPSCRFAIENYFTGGRHPIGRIGVGKAIANLELDGNCFNDPATDATISYRTG
jgi:hypothetical protein